MLFRLVCENLRGLWTPAALVYQSPTARVSLAEYRTNMCS